MTTDEAIKCYERQCASGVFTEADDVALSALKEKQEREKGCEYCTVNGRLAIAMHADTEIVDFAPPQKQRKCLCRPLKYCPVCGRELPKEAAK